MNSPQALKLIEQLKKQVAVQDLKDETITTISDQLMKIREISMIEKNPTVTKSLRLASEHIKENQSFLVKIPFDSQDEQETESEDRSIYSDSYDSESLSYFLSLIESSEKKVNLLEIKEYNKAFLDFN